MTAAELKKWCEDEAAKPSQCDALSASKLREAMVVALEELVRPGSWEGNPATTVSVQADYIRALIAELRNP